LENYFERQYELRYYEMNRFGEASPAIILALLEETAAEHCYSIDHSLYDLMKQNIGWILVSGVMKMDRYPKYKEPIVIRTWLSSYSTVKGYRENLIYDGQGNIIGRAKGLWIFFDIQRRRPLQISDKILQSWQMCKETSIDHDIAKKIEPVDNVSYIKEFRVNQSDIDMYKHANNLKYLQWLLDSIPEEITQNKYMHFLDGRFISEIQYGDEIVMLSNKHDDDNTFIHTIKSKDKICATAITSWKDRD